MSKQALLVTSTLILLTLGLSLFTVPFANAADSTWQKTFGGTAADKAYSMIKTLDGGYALIGTTNSFGSGLISSYLVKTDNDGNLQWNQTYGGIGQAIADTVFQTTDEGFAFAGYTYSLAEGNGALSTWLAKTDYTGTLQWNQTYNQLGTAIAYSVIQTSDKGYALGGGYNPPAGGVEGWMSKTDANGALQWNKTFGTLGYDQINAIIQISDGGYLLGGSASPTSSGPSSPWLIKVDSDGNTQWNQTYTSLGNQILGTAIKTSDGGYAIIATSQVSNVTLDDFALLKTDSFGVLQWSKTYNGQNIDDALSGIQTSDGGYAIAGVTNSSNPIYAKAWIVKTDSTGNKQWDHTYGGNGQNAAISIVQANDGGYVIGGFTNSTGAGKEDFWLLKTDANGINAQQPTETPTPTGTASANPSATPTTPQQTGFATWAIIGIAVVVIVAIVVLVIVFKRK